VAISGNQFSDAGDSGSLVVDAANAEPVGLFFAGGIDASGVSQGVASPAPDVLNELSAQLGGGTTYSFVGGPDHAVSCLSYGDNTLGAAQNFTLTGVENVRAQQALAQARTLINSTTGVLGVATGKSSDHAGESAVILYVDEAASGSAPQTVYGVRTLVIPTTARAVANGSAPLTPLDTTAAPLPNAALNQAVSLKQQIAQRLMKHNQGFFGVGVGQSLDNPKEAALVIYVDRKNVPASLPQTIDGLRTHYVVMDRMHVTRAYAAPVETRSRCMPHPVADQRSLVGTDGFDSLDLTRPRILKLN